MAKNKIKIFISAVFLFALPVLLSSTAVYADHNCDSIDLEAERQICLDTPHNTTTELNTGSVDVTGNPIYTRLNTIINVLSVGVGIVITASVVYAGIQYIMSRGDPNKTQAAIHRITQAGIALALYVFGWTILNWLIPGGVFQ